MKIKRIVWRQVRNLILKWMNYPRYIIEKKIFPSIKNKRVLLVGCTHHVGDYPKKLRKNDVYSIDINPEMEEFGAKKHIIGNVVEIDKYFKEGFFDVIFLLGVFGYGLNEPKEAEKTMKNCYKVLKKGGILIILCKDISGCNQIVPEKLKNYRLFTSISYGIKNEDLIKSYKMKKTIFNFLLKEDT